MRKTTSKKLYGNFSVYIHNRLKGHNAHTHTRVACIDGEFNLPSYQCTPKNVLLRNLCKKIAAIIFNNNMLDMLVLGYVCVAAIVVTHLYTFHL